MTTNTQNAGMGFCRRQGILFLLATVGIANANIRVNVNLGVGHPLPRPARTVIVRRPAPVVRTNIIYAAPVVWTRTVVSLPPRDRLVWEDSETFRRRED